MRERIRNFSIIAHVDHGKSTLADRILEFCGALETRTQNNQVLDNMDIERERGITIKAQTVRLKYVAKDGLEYELNLIDTPGHVDFAYEVSRSLAACEGSLMVVDASQGVEAQTIANVYQAVEANHELIPVLNKIDLPSADIEGVKQQINEVFGIDTSEAILTSAKAGIGIAEIMEAIVKKIPAPKGESDRSLEALLIDSWYDSYMGVVVLFRVINGEICQGQKIRMMAAEAAYQIESLGVFTPKKVFVEKLGPGQIGFATAHIKNISDCQVGDTITDDKKPAKNSLKGFKPSIPVVFCGLFPTDAKDFPILQESLAKLHLNDASFQFEKETSLALGFGFRCGFLGLLHLEIIQERLEQEFDLDLLLTAPSVVYKIHLTDGTVIDLHNPADMPEPVKIDFIEEPWIQATILTPEGQLGDVMQLLSDRRGKQIDLQYTGSRIMLIYELPLNEVVFDFYDRLKSISRGYASFDYHISGYKPGDLVKMSILVNNEPVDALASIVFKGNADRRGRALCEKLKDLIPRHLFQIPIQAAVGGKIIARENISALRKDVTAKCYGGDITRKRKLLEKQKAGKKRMRTIGNVDIPQSAFLAVLKLDKD